MRKGTVKFFDAGKGYGSITDDAGGKDAFVHVSAVQAAGMLTLDKDQRFSYELASDERGKSSAVNLQAARPADREALGGPGATLHPPRRLAVTSLETSRARSRDTADKPDPASANQPLDNWENEGGSFTPSAAREIRRILEAAQMPTQQVDARPRSYLLYALKGALNGAVLSVADLDAAIINPENLIGHERDAWEQLHHWADEGEVRARDKNYFAFHLDWLRDLHSKLAQ